MRVIAGPRGSRRRVACPPAGPLADACGTARASTGCPCRRWTPACGSTRSRLRSGWHSSRPAAWRSRGRPPRGAGRDPREHPPSRTHGGHRATAGRRPLRGPRARAPAAEPRRTRHPRRCSRGARRRSWPTPTTRPHGSNEGLGRAAGRRASTTASTTRASTPSPCARRGCATSWGSGQRLRLLGQVAQITPWKGQDASIRTLAGLRQAGVDAHLALVGEIAFGGKGVRYDNHAFLPRSRPRQGAGRAERGALPRPARRRARDPAPRSTSPCCLPGRSPSGLPWWRAWPWASPAGHAGRRRPRAGGGPRVRPRCWRRGSRDLGGGRT